MIALDFISVILTLVLAVVLPIEFLRLRRRRQDWLESCRESDCRSLGEKILRKAQDDGAKAIVIRTKSVSSSEMISSTSVDFLFDEGEVRTVMFLPTVLHHAVLAHFHRHRNDSVDSDGLSLPLRRLYLGARDSDILLRIDLEPAR